MDDWAFLTILFISAIVSPAILSLVIAILVIYATNNGPKGRW